VIDKVPITKEGLEKLRRELQTILAVDRPKNIKAISEARAHGDLNENAEYHAAKERQSFLEGRIHELEMAINKSEVIEIDSAHKERVIFGATVQLRNVTKSTNVVYQLVGPFESDPENGKISITSPLGTALIGKEEEDSVTIKTPGGIQEYEIVEIR
jgi:transcription elongation factor GreA